MKKYIYCHKVSALHYDDIAIVIAQSKEEAINVLLNYYNDVPKEYVHEIKEGRKLRNNNGIQIISDY